MRLVWLVLVACIGSSLMPGQAAAQSAGRITGAVPASGGFALVVWGGGTADALRGAAQADGCTLRSVFVTDTRGEFTGYVYGAPAVVNAAFIALFPGLDLPASTALIVVCASAAPPAPAGPPGSISLVPALGGRTFSRPIEFGAYPGGRVYLAQQEGNVSLMDPSGGNETTFLDLRSQVSRASNEEGFLGLAFAPGSRSVRTCTSITPSRAASVVLALRASR
jgi:hypothetical protein